MKVIITIIVLIAVFFAIRSLVVVELPQPDAPLVTKGEVHLRDIKSPSKPHPQVCGVLPQGATVIYKDYLKVFTGSGEDIIYYKVMLPDGCTGWGDMSFFKK